MDREAGTYVKISGEGHCRTMWRGIGRIGWEIGIVNEVRGIGWLTESAANIV